MDLSSFSFSASFTSNPSMKLAAIWSIDWRRDFLILYVKNKNKQNNTNTNRAIIPCDIREGQPVRKGGLTLQEVFRDRETDFLFSPIPTRPAFQWLVRTPYSLDNEDCLIEWRQVRDKGSTLFFVLSP